MCHDIFSNTCEGEYFKVKNFIDITKISLRNQQEKDLIKYFHIENHNLAI